MAVFTDARYGFAWNYAPGDAGWGTTYNYGQRAVAALMCCYLLDISLTIPPGSPVDGDTYYVPAGAVGAWSGQAGKIGSYQGGAWQFYEIPLGFRARVVSPTAGWYWWNGAWTAESAGVSTSTTTVSDLEALDFSTLPTTNPGSGKLWLNGGVLQVGV